MCGVTSVAESKAITNNIRGLWESNLLCYEVIIAPELYVVLYT